MNYNKLIKLVNKLSIKLFEKVKIINIQNIAYMMGIYDCGFFYDIDNVEECSNIILSELLDKNKIERIHKLIDQLFVQLDMVTMSEILDMSKNDITLFLEWWNKEKRKFNELTFNNEELTPFGVNSLITYYLEDIPTLQ